MVYIFLADGFEETEAITPADILKRGGVDVCFCSIYDDRKEVFGTHGIKITADVKLSDVNEAEMFIMPGGLPGAYNLRDCKRVEEIIKKQNAKGKWVSAICAAPTVLGLWGILSDKKATCYPALKNELKSKEYSEEKAVLSGNVITGKGPGASAEFGFEMLKALKGEKIANAVKNDMCF